MERSHLMTSATGVTIAGARRIEKPWGYELLWAHSAHYAGKLLHVEPGRRLSLQYHREKHETLYLLSGCADVDVQTADGIVRTVPARPGDVFVVEPGMLHRIAARTTCEFLEVSTPELDDVVRVADDYGR